ncbi:DUF421 domain-containing protein [Pontibacter ramchanderi]|uniref:Uncharacterized protein DUF421 n=1 Tax=Pontibacter ramchanderi TaxID=1179743 RepID=A0A2N3V3A8_9BACT|nr:YetF domain-containing protein [Pontibacter ramchanderi]PKV76114.1 uncharacterized protein DUF421 [Pontibacter ramchanderi]
MTENLFFDNWDSLLRTFAVTVMAYLVIVFLLRVSGKRTLSKMNAFDFIVTVALGSVLATVSLNKDVTLADGAMSFGVLIFMQYLLTWLSVRYKAVKRLVTCQPALLLYKGEVLPDALQHARVTLEELHLRARKEGIGDLKEIDAMVLEATGEITVISKINTQSPRALQEVQNFRA